jgi:putative aminophosphonate oxidoreductase
VLSLWEREIGASEAPASTLEGEIRADVCIVGGGFLGLWTAIRIRELDPAAEVVVLDAGRCGGGAAGRNGGFVLSWWSKFLTLERLCGTDEALRLCSLSTDAIKDLEAFCDANAIDCGFRPDGWIWSATNGVQIGSWRGTVERLESLGEQPFVELTPAEIAARTGSPVHLAGVMEASAATVQPAALARGLRRVVVERGVRIFENSPMLRLEGTDTASVVTGRGRIEARTVVLALSAWTGAIGELRRHLIVVASDVVATDPAPGRLAEIGWSNGVSISDSRQLVHYYRTTEDGRIVFGKGGGDLAFRDNVGASFFEAPSRAAVVERHFRATYPTLDEIPVTSSWSGPVDRTKTGLPVFSHLHRHPGVVYGFGFSGNGVGPSVVGGCILASLALSRNDGWSGAGLVRDPTDPFPPEPIRFLGGRLVRAAVARKERCDDRGQRADPLTRALSTLTPNTRGAHQRGE